ncbi:MAG: toll/interleukin-1 receptor domain-containing protein [Halobacteriaceae archaeon]
MGSVFVEPLKGRERVGEVFISHVTEDEDRIQTTLVSDLINSGIPYFLSDEDIAPGEDWLDRLDQATSRASCGIVVLTENSLDSAWVWYETGILQGLNKPIYPLLLDDIDMSTIPEFISQKQVSETTDEIVESLEEEVREFGQIAEATDFDPDDLRRVTVTMTLDTEDYPESVVESLSFGYQLIGFDMRMQTESDVIDREEVLLMPVEADSVVRQPDAVKIEYSVPLHERFGVEFKPFIEVHDPSDIDPVISMLEEDIFLDPSQSASGERQRVYFLLPIGDINDDDLGESGNIVHDGDGNLNNWLYPQ